MAGAMEKIKAKVEHVLHKDQDTTHDTTHTGTTSTHTGTTGTHGTYSTFSASLSVNCCTNNFQMTPPVLTAPTQPMWPILVSTLSVMEELATLPQLAATVPQALTPAHMARLAPV